MRFLACLVFAIALIALAFHFAKPLPGVNFDESFLPKASSVKYIAAGENETAAGLFWIKGLTELGESYLTGKEYAYLGHVANLATELDSLFYTPYSFVSSVVPNESQDTSDLQVLRRALVAYPDDWRLAVCAALRFSRGPTQDNRAAAAAVKRFFASPDTTIPEHIRLLYRSFELKGEQTETALEMILNDVIQPQFKKFRKSFYIKTYRTLGYQNMVTTHADSVIYNDVGNTIELLADRKIHPQQAFVHLMQLRKVEDVADSASSDTTESLESAKADSTAASVDSAVSASPSEKN